MTRTGLAQDVRLRSLEGAFTISQLQVARDYLLARLASLGAKSRRNGGVDMPLPVRQEFAKMVAVKVLAWLGRDGYPSVVPALSLQPAAPQTLLCWLGSKLPSPPADAWAATNILTFEAISYQAKGLWTAEGRTGSIQVREVDAGGPPLPGGRVA